jgi:sugar transferase (PEP-CTERM system associated)
MMRTLNQHYLPKVVLFFLVEGLLIILSAALAVFFRFVFVEGFILDYHLLLTKTLIITAVCQTCLTYNDLYSLKNGRYFQDLVPRLFQSILAAALILVILYYLFPGLAIGRGIFLINLSLCPLLLFSWRYGYRWMVDRRLLNERILIIGSGPLAKEIGAEILSLKSLGYQIVGFIDHDPAMVGVRLLNPSIIGEYLQLTSIAQQEGINRIIVAPTERRGKMPIDALLHCKLSGIKIEDGISFFEQITGKIPLEGLKPSWLIFSDGFKIQKATRVVKRSMDIFFSIVGLILAIPFFLMIPLLIRLDSPGPIFYLQERVGENGRLFRLIKFRSMGADAEAEVGPVWAQDDDSRVTRIGMFLRRTRMDEIPQLFNVLKGEMSFVGPRPERPCFVEQLNQEIPYYRLRFSLKPGITGWAQIRYRYGSSVKDAFEKLQYELYYIKNLSLFLDLAILFSTVRVVLSGRGAR